MKKFFIFMLGIGAWLFGLPCYSGVPVRKKAARTHCPISIRRKPVLSKRGRVEGSDRDKKFSWTHSKFFEDGDFKNCANGNSCIWEGISSRPFSELILSWNAFRPKNKEKFVFYVSVRHNNWSRWYKLAEWNSTTQQTFVDAKNAFVHSKHVRVELNRGRKATAFKIKVVSKNGADLKKVKALFVNLVDMNNFHIQKADLTLPSTRVKWVPKQSQKILKHPRRHDLCSPTSISMLVSYFQRRERSINLPEFVPNFADKVHDDCYLDIYGNWILNVAQAFDSSGGNTFFRVERLNDFNHLYSYLQRKIPIAVSVRGRLKGGAKNYNNGHFMVVVGWDKKRQAVLCIDPAFWSNSKTMRAYSIKNFLRVWGTSRNLSYVAMPKKLKFG